MHRLLFATRAILVHTGAASMMQLPSASLTRWSVQPRPLAVWFDPLTFRGLHAPRPSPRGDGSGSEGKCRAAGSDGEWSRGERLLRLLGKLGGFYSRKAVCDVLSRSAKALYNSCVDSADYAAIIRACGLSDSFQSWFLVVQLHVWFCLVRLKREGGDGRLVSRKLVSMFWYDVEQRMRVLGVHSGSVRYRSQRELVQEFSGLILAYEEGLLNDDRTLAAAVWRNLVQEKARTEPTQLGVMVDYIRRQVQHMDKLDSEQLLRRGNVKMLTFHT